MKNTSAYKQHLESFLSEGKESLSELQERIRSHEIDKLEQHSAEVEALAQEYEVIKAQYRQLEKLTGEKWDHLKQDIESKIQTFQTNMQQAFHRIK